MFRKYGTDTYKTSDRNLLRHLTVPGQRVSFYLRTYTDILEKKPAKHKVEGTVTAVYPHIFFWTMENAISGLITYWVIFIRSLYGFFIRQSIGSS